MGLSDVTSLYEEPSNAEIIPKQSARLDSEILASEVPPQIASFEARSSINYKPPGFQRNKTFVDARLLDSAKTSLRDKEK